MFVHFCLDLSFLSIPMFLLSSIHLKAAFWSDFYTLYIPEFCHLL